MRDDVAHRQHLLFTIRKSIRYHNARRQFYERLHAVAAALCVTFGTATTFAALSGAGPYWAAGMAAVVTVIATLDLVSGTPAKIRLHHDLARRLIGLEKQVIRKLHPNALDIRSWEADRLDVQADEPPRRHVLDTMVYNELLQAYGADPSEQIQVRWYQRWLAHVLDVHVHRLVERKSAPAEILSVVEPEDEPMAVAV
ncbi:MAG TPA: hypothetical protein VFG50_07020 [Rhodothermales bacterium]|nr:hypothetical protein [Rhodothermales bacterium]